MNVSSLAELVIIASGKARLAGMVGLPPGAHGLLLFAHGSGSGRLSQRHSYVADELRRAGLGTLLLDLLEEEAAEDRQKVAASDGNTYILRHDQMREEWELGAFRKGGESPQ